MGFTDYLPLIVGGLAAFAVIVAVVLAMRRRKNP
jgi:hypothetical protein